MESVSGQPGDTNNNTSIRGNAQVSHGDFVGGNKETHIHNLNYVDSQELLEAIKQVASQEKPIPQPKRQRIPPLLPYLADRSEQEDQLELLLRAHNWLYPLVFIIHGDEYQCHEKFYERLQYHTLPKFLDLDDETKISAYHVEWPAKLLSLDELPRRLLQSLSKSVLGRGTGTIPEIQLRLASYSSPTIFHLHLLSSDWMKYDNTILDCIFRFWRDWPELSPRQFMFVLLFIKYERIHSKKGFFRFSQSLNDRIFQQLANINIEKYHPLSGKVLPMLEGISRSEAEAWARHPDVRKFCDSELLTKEIRDLYDGATKEPKGQISMEKLVQRLEAVLQKQFSLQEGT